MPSLAEIFQQALTLQKHGENADAIAIYQQLLEQFPDHLASRYNLSCLLAETQHWEEAISQLAFVLEQEPHCTPAYYNLAICYQALNKDLEAIQCLEETLKQDPQHVMAMQTLGGLLLKQERYEEAKNYLLSALQENPSDSDLLFNLGLAFLNEGDDINALYYFTKLRETKPYLIDAAYNCGVIYQKAGNYPAALRAFAHVLQYHPQHFASLYNSGLIYQLTQQYPLAKDFYHRALEVEPENTSLLFLIAALEQKPTPEIPSDHIKNLFDHYAGHYDQHMQKDLQYTVPQQLYQLFTAQITPEPKSLCAIDLGCGTGLMGEYFHPFCHTLVGIDLSPKMLTQAASKYFYTTVTQQDNIKYLKKLNQDVDLILAADVLGYYGDVEPLFAACEQALRTQGYFLFSIETHGHFDDYLLAPHARFLHNLHYIHNLATDHHFTIIAEQKTILRHEQHEPVHGQLLLLQKIV